MANPQQGGYTYVVPETYALRAELIAKDDDVVKSRQSVQRLLEQETVGQWTRLVLEEFGNNWLLRIALRIKEVRDGSKKYCIIACGGGNDILVLINTTKMPKDVRTIPRIGVDVCLGNSKAGAVDRDDPMNNYGVLSGTDTLRDHIQSEFATGATDVRLFVDTADDTFVDVSEGSIKDKRVVRFTILKNADWQAKSVDRESVDPTIFHLRDDSNAVAVAAPPSAQHQDGESSREEERANPSAKISKKWGATDKEHSSEKAKASSGSDKKKRAHDKTGDSTGDTNKSSADESDKKPAASPKRKAAEDDVGDKDTQPSAAEKQTVKKRKVDKKSAGDESTAKRKPALCYWYPYCEKYASECGGHSRNGCTEVSEGRVIIPEDLSEEQLIKEKRKAKKKLQRLAALNTGESSGTHTAGDDSANTAGKDVTNEEASMRLEKNDKELLSKNALASSASAVAKKASKKKMDSTAADSKSSDDESNKKPAAPQKRKETDDKGVRFSSLERSKSEKTTIVHKSGNETAAKRKSALCYWFPYCKKYASECGGHNRQGCIEVLEGRVVIPEDLSYDQLKKEKRNAKKKLKKVSDQKADEPSGQNTADKDATNGEEDDAEEETDAPHNGFKKGKRKAEKKLEKVSDQANETFRGDINEETAKTADKEATTNRDDDDDVSSTSAISDGVLAKFAVSSDGLCYYFPFCRNFAKDCGGVRRGTCKEVNKGRVKIPSQVDEFETVKKKTKSKVKKLRKSAHDAEKAAKEEAVNHADDEENGSDASTVTEQPSPNRPSKSNKRKEFRSSKPSPKPVKKSKEESSGDDQQQE